MENFPGCRHRFFLLMQKSDKNALFTCYIHSIGLKDVSSLLLPSFCVCRKFSNFLYLVSFYTKGNEKCARLLTLGKQFGHIQPTFLLSSLWSQPVCREDNFSASFRKTLTCPAHLPSHTGDFTGLAVVLWVNLHSCSLL